MPPDSSADWMTDMLCYELTDRLTDTHITLTVYDTMTDHLQIALTIGY
jgi:hypothetical protein